MIDQAEATYQNVDELPSSFKDRITGNPHVLAGSPLSISVAEIGGTFVMSFMEVSMKPASEDMAVRVNGLSSAFFACHAVVLCS